MTDTTYNGWSNRATWQLNLEMCDDLIESLRGDIPKYAEPFAGLASLADYLQDTCEQLVQGDDYLQQNTATQYALSYLGMVNWYEIAENHADDNPWLLVSDEDDDDGSDDDN